MSPCEALELLQKGVKLEYYRKDDDYWWTLYKDQPIYILWKYEIRIKKMGLYCEEKELKKT